MSPYPRLMVLSAVWMVLLVIGSERTVYGAAPETAPTDAVLKADDNVSTIVRKVIEAHGGEKAFTRWSCGELEFKTKHGIVPPELGEVTVKDTFQLPGQFKRVVRTAAEGQEQVMVFVVNGDQAWTKSGDEPARPMGGGAPATRQHPFAVFFYLSPLTEAGTRLTKLGAEKINGKDVIGIRAHSETTGEADFYFATQSGLQVKIRKSVVGHLAADPARPSVMETYLDDYRNVQGSPVPMRIEGVRDGQPILNVTLTEVKFADKLEASLFAKP